MPLLKYVYQSFNTKSRALIEHANSIIATYAADGYDLTLRQLYYQFVSRGLLPNTQKNYKSLGDLISNARLAGLIDWDHITDRTRNLMGLASWSSPGSLVESCVNRFHLDRWATQDVRPEVWIEKEALAGVFARVCGEYDVDYFCCRGYTSQSEMWVASQRLIRYRDNGQTPMILHFGDHDPSGIDMSRDIRDRLKLFGADVKFDRRALNWEQVQEYQPPPNPAKATDARYKSYEEQFGDECWELDALEPNVLAGLVRDWVLSHRDEEKWKEIEADEQKGREKIKKAVAAMKKSR